jgi:hypothetical protein
MSEKRHPGYVLGNHWLQTAYERICAGEAEADVLADYGVTRTDQPNAAPNTLETGSRENLKAGQPDAALMTADERRLEDYMAMWRGTRDRLQRVLAAIRRCEVSHTGMSYGDEKSGDVTGYTRGWGDCLKAVKKAVSTADQQSLPRMRCPECGKPYVRVETDYGPGEHADCACLDAPADKPSDA